MLIPWERWKYLAWDATIIHTCAASYISNQSGLGRSAAEQAADRKIKKYEEEGMNRKRRMSVVCVWGITEHMWKSGQKDTQVGLVREVR